MLARKILVIVLLISLIAGYFYLRPYLSAKEEEPHITDRIPVGDFIGKIKLLDLARETNAFLYHNKLPFRDFLTVEFILSQSKNCGINVQRPIYFFSNENGEWGSLLTVNDSSKINAGFLRLKRDVTLEDTIVGGQKVIKIPKEKIYMTYGKYWLFVYHGKQLPRRMYDVIYSKKGEINPIWKKFEQNHKFDNETVVVASNWNKIQKYGIEEAIFTHDSDSTEIAIKSYFKHKDGFDFSIKKEGLGLAGNGKNDKSVNFHFDIEKIRNNPNAPLKLLLHEFAKRVSFPVEAFFKAWDGDISFNEGGMHTVKESYIETLLDEEFNTLEVKKEKDVQVPGYMVLLSMNEHQKSFVSNLFAKGIMRKDDNRFYVLTSPPLKINQNKKYLMLYSSQHAPKIVSNNRNGGTWKDSKTRYDFNLDSLNKQELFFSFRFSGVSFFKKNKFLY